MRVDWLEDLVALLDAGSMSEAAAARNISQSAFSRRIQALEDVTGIELTNRDVKPVRPSVVLKAHDEELRRAALGQHQLIKRMQQESRSQRQLVVIASQHSITTSLGPEIIDAVSNLGKAHVRLRSANLDECHALLMTGQADVSLTYKLPDGPAMSSPELTQELVIAQERLTPVFRKDQAKSLIWKFHAGELDMIAYPADVFLGIAIGSNILPGLERQCRLNIVAETALTTAAMRMSVAGSGVSWVPEVLARHELDNGVLADLREPLGHIDMQLIARRRRDKTEGMLQDIWVNLARMVGG